MIRLSGILTAPMARHPSLFFRKLSQKIAGAAKCSFAHAPSANVSYGRLNPLVAELNRWFQGVDGDTRKLEWNEVFKQEFDEEFLLRCCRDGILEDASGLKGDIKLPWEFSRGYSHIVNALRCRSEEDKDACAHEISTQIQRWQEFNDDPNGVNWLVAMEVAIRAFNWLCADALLEGRIAEDVGRQKFYDLLWNHGRIIWDRLEYSLSGVSNHYTADLLGLTVLGLFFGESAEGAEWLRFAKSEMRASLLLHQVNKDGGLKECSLRYHCLVTEMALHFYALLEGRVGRRMKDRLIRMCQVVADYTDCSSGDVFAFGDDDGSRIVPLDFVCDRGRGELLTAYAEQLLETDFEASDSALHKHSGWGVLRAAGYELAVDFGPVSGGHAHCDSLSFALSYQGQPLIVDPGSGIYTPDLELRDRLRSISQHSTVQIDGREQGLMGQGYFGAFNMRGPKKSCKSEICQSCLLLENQNPARGLRAPCHKRTLKFDGNVLSVVDRVNGAANSIVWRFAFHPSVNVHIEANGFSLICEAFKFNLRASIQNLKFSLMPGLYSSFYGNCWDNIIGVVSLDLPKGAPENIEVSWRLSQSANL